jgi:hypothetical protein
MSNEKQLFVITHELASRKRAVAAVAAAPENWRVEIKPQKRGLDINAALHAKLGEIAKTHKWAGKRWDIETWKRLLVAAWHRATGQQVVMLPSLDGAGVDIVFRRTSDMTQSEMRDLMAFVEAWEAEFQAGQ